MGRCILRLFALDAVFRLIFLLQRPLDAVQEEGVLLDALPLEVLLPNRKVGSNTFHVLRLPPLAAASKTA